MGYQKLSVAVGVSITEEQVARIRSSEPRLEVRWEPELIPPLRFPSDYEGDPDWHRTPEQKARFFELCSSSQVLFGLPANSPNLLRACVEANPDLIWVQSVVAGAGGQVRAAKLAPADLERVILTSAAGVHERTLAEYAIFGVLAGAKELPRLEADKRNKVWTGRRPVRHLFEMTIGVVGMGHIGRETAARFADLGATVIGVNRSMREIPGVEMHLDADLVEVASRCDALINCLPAAVGTDNLISAEVLAALKPDAIVVSLGRGSCVDEPALIRLLQSGHLAYAAMDVFAHEPLPEDSPLWTLPNVLVSPHNMAMSVHEMDRVIDVFLRNATALLDGAPLENLVDKQLFY
jgi:phosphoglycerate dehydrogenase-like enzyme